MPEIDTGTAGKTLGQLVGKVLEGEVFTLTRYGKPVAVLGPIAEPIRATPPTVEVVKPVAANVKASVRAQTHVHSEPELDDWGLPVTRDPAATEAPTSNTHTVRTTTYSEPRSITARSKPAVDDDIPERPSLNDIKAGKYPAGYGKKKR